MMTLYICSYNNYYNRILKKESDIMGYLGSVKYVVPSTNFNPNDGVNTTHVIGNGEYNGGGDYVIALEGNEIQSRWFIIDSVRTRAGQYELTLRRDLLVDFWADVRKADCFIEKAILPSSSTLIFNSENMTFNQIKTGETLLKDLSGCPWIVGYYAKDTPPEYLTGIVNRNTGAEENIKIINVPFESWEFNATERPFEISPTEVVYKVNTTFTLPYTYVDATLALSFNKKGQYGGTLASSPGVTTNSGYRILTYSSEHTNMYTANYIGERMSLLMQEQSDVLYTQVGAYSQICSKEKELEFLSLNNALIKDENGRVYRLTVQPSGETSTKEINVISGNLFRTLQNICDEVKSPSPYDVNYFSGQPDENTFKVSVEAPLYSMSAERVAYLETTWNISSANRVTTEDAPYNIFAIPFGAVQLKEKDGTTICTSTADFGIATANSIIKTMGSYLYDIQLVPYCPLPLLEAKKITVSTGSVGNEYGTIVQPTAGGIDIIVGFIMNIPQTRFTHIIELVKPITINNTKISNECDMYKLCSPNWASEFQFSAAKNYGVDYFKAECEYKPFQPYIHVCPNFKGLYKRDFGDARGLICAGDFSLAQISDQWVSYQINNKNYQAMFDRQIQNMEVQHKYQRISDVAGAVTGTLSGGVMGAALGSKGGPVGALAGAVGGAALSAAGGVIDYQINEKLRNEALDYTQDQFGYQLGNIQALPYTLTKVSAYNNNNKLFPVLEYYTCSESEKRALANKIAYNSMTVGVIGKIENYEGITWSYGDIEAKGYIKARLIRLEIPGEDFHVINSIAGELNKGVYTT